MTLYFFAAGGGPSMPKSYPFPVASFRGLGRPEQEEKVFAFGELAGSGLEKARPHFDGIERTHGFRFDLWFRTGRSHFDLAAVAFRVQRKQGDVFHRLAIREAYIKERGRNRHPVLRGGSARDSRWPCSFSAGPCRSRRLR